MVTDANKELVPDRTALYAIIQWYRSSQRKRLYVGTANCSSVASSGLCIQPKLMSVDNVMRGEGAKVSFSLRLAMGGCWQVETYGPGYSIESYNSLEEVLQEYPDIFYGATASLYVESIADDGTVSVGSLGSAQIENHAFAGPHSIDFYAEYASELRRKKCPQKTIGVDIMWGDETAIDDLKGEPAPLALGDYLPYTRWDFALHPWLRYSLGILGWKVPTMAALPASKRTSAPSQLRSVYNERVTGGFDGTYDDYGTGYVECGDQLGRFYDVWRDQLGNVINGIEGGFITKPGYYGIEHLHRPFVQVPVIPEPLNDGATYKFANAVDGNPNTYATIPNGGWAYFRLPRGTPYGRICLNTTDAGATPALDKEGVGRPVGLKAMCVTVRPTGFGVPTGSITLAFCYPDGTPFLDGTAYAASQIDQPPVFDEYAKLTQVNIAYMTGTPKQGWAGTRWHQWDFTSGGSTDTEDSDFPILSPGGENYLNQPMLLKFANNSGVAVGLGAILLLVGCQANSDPTTTGLAVKSEGHYDWPNLRARWESRTEIVRYGVPELDISDWVQEHWRIVGIDARARARIGRPRGTSKVRAATSTWKDDDSGTLTGVPNGLINDPVAMARMLLQVYGGVSAENICSGTELGSYSVARNLLRSWYFAGQNVLDWPINLQFTSHTDTNAAIPALCEHALGLRLVKYPSGKRGFLVWHPVVALDGGRIYSATPLDARRLLMRDGDGSPLIHVSRSRASDVINSLKLRYRGDLRTVASCDWAGSDDGDGDDEWPLIPYSNGTVPAGSGGLCDVSRLRYGEAIGDPIEMGDTWDKRVVLAQGLYILARYWQPEILLQATCGLGAYDLLEGHVFRWSNELETALGYRPIYWGTGVQWENLYWEVVNNELMDDGLSIVHEITARWLPYEIGAGARGGIWGGTDGVESTLLGL